MIRKVTLCLGMFAYQGVGMEFLTVGHRDAYLSPAAHHIATYRHDISNMVTKHHTLLLCPRACHGFAVS